MSGKKTKTAFSRGFVRSVAHGANGVKAVEDDRSPSPGGTTEHVGTDERLWGPRWGFSEASGGLVGMHEIAESRGDFILQDADGEMVMPHDCPEIKGKAEG